MSFKIKLHFWVGLTQLSEQRYWDYFDASHGLPQFCKDIGLEWLDQDFMGYYFNQQNTDLKLIIENTPEPDHYQVMLEDCIEKGLNKANAMFYYWGDESILVDQNKKYNTLTYIGNYDWDE